MERPKTVYILGDITLKNSGGYFLMKKVRRKYENKVRLFSNM